METLPEGGDSSEEREPESHVNPHRNERVNLWDLGSEGGRGPSSEDPPRGWETTRGSDGGRADSPEDENSFEGEEGGQWGQGDSLGSCRVSRFVKCAAAKRGRRWVGKMGWRRTGRGEARSEFCLETHQFGRFIQGLV